MRIVLVVALAAAAIGLAIPATAAVTLTATNGTPLANQIFGIKSTGNPVFGSTPNNTNVVGVTYTGNSTMDIKNGFAQIDDADSKNPSFGQVIINPILNFTDMKFSVQLTGAGNVSVYYLLAGSALDANAFASYTQLAGSFAADNSESKELISGGTFTGILIKSTTPNVFLSSIKQNSFTSAVPEPATWAMMLVGFGVMGGSLRRSRRRQLLQIA